VLLIVTALAGWLFAVPAARAQGKGNMHLGNADFDLAGTFEVEWNDNINYSNSNRQSDIILRPGLTFGTSYKLTQFNTINFNLGISYQQYLIHPGLSSYNTFASISPNSQLSFTFKVGAVTIKVYDSFSYAVQPSDAVAYNSSTGTPIYSITQFARFTNQIGLSADWTPRQHLTVYGGAYRYDVIPQESNFQILRRWQYTALGGFRYIFSPQFTAGIGATATADYYQQNYNNNSYSVFMGPTFVYQPDSFWTFNTSFGYTYYDFQNTGTNADTSQPSTFTGQLTITNRLTDNIDHSLTFSRTSSFGYTSNTLDIDRVAYQISWRFKPKWTFNVWAYYEEGFDSGGINPETYHKYAVSPGLEYEMNDRTTIYTSYEFLQKDSNIAVRTYDRNRVIIGVHYDF